MAVLRLPKFRREPTSRLPRQQRAKCHARRRAGLGKTHDRYGPAITNWNPAYALTLSIRKCLRRNVCFARCAARALSGAPADFAGIAPRRIEESPAGGGPDVFAR